MSYSTDDLLEFQEERLKSSSDGVLREQIQQLETVFRELQSTNVAFDKKEFTPMMKQLNDAINKRLEIIADRIIDQVNM